MFSRRSSGKYRISWRQDGTD